METTATRSASAATWNVTPRSYSAEGNTNSAFACLELKRDNNEFCRSAHRNVDKDPQYSFPGYLPPSCWCPTDVYRKCFFGFLPRQCALAPEAEKKIFDHCFQGSPVCASLGFKHNHPAPSLNTLFDERDRASYRHVSPIHAVTIMSNGRPISIFLAGKQTEGIDRLTVKRHIHGFPLFIR